MARVASSLAAAALIVAGGAADHFISSASTSSSAVSANSVQPASSASSLDAATEHAFAIASPSVVYVENVGVGSGSGVIYDSRGDIVTNAHVVDQAQKITVTLSTGKTYTAKLLGTDVADDLAVLHINASNTPAAHFAGSAQFQVARTVLAIGSPLGYQQSVTSGLISALNRTVQEGNGAYLPNALQTSATINHGNSGGALVTLDGTVIGIPTLEAVDPQNNNGGAAQGIGFAVPSTRVTYIAHQIITTGKVEHTGRAYLGGSFTDASQQASSQFSFGFGGGQQLPAGAIVQQVVSGGPLDRAGVQQGDVITKANGATITSESDLLVALAHAKPGSIMTLTIDRQGSTITAKVHLGELPAS
jgi:S1-C subfamily serine protease